MTGVKPQTSGVWSNRFTNWATTTLFIIESNLCFSGCWLHDGRIYCPWSPATQSSSPSIPLLPLSDRNCDVTAQQQLTLLELQQVPISGTSPTGMSWASTTTCSSSTTRAPIKVSDNWFLFKSIPISVRAIEPTPQRAKSCYFQAERSDVEIKNSPSFFQVAQKVASPGWLKMRWFSQLPKNSPNIWATFVTKFIAKKFQKSPNLVTLFSGLRCRSILRGVFTSPCLPMIPSSSTSPRNPWWKSTALPHRFVASRAGLIHRCMTGFEPRSSATQCRKQPLNLGLKADWFLEGKVLLRLTPVWLDWRIYLSLI